MKEENLVIKNNNYETSNYPEKDEDTKYKDMLNSVKGEGIIGQYCIEENESVGEMLGSGSFGRVFRLNNSPINPNGKGEVIKIVDINNVAIDIYKSYQDLKVLGSYSPEDCKIIQAWKRRPVAYYVEDIKKRLEAEAEAQHWYTVNVNTNIVKDLQHKFVTIDNKEFFLMRMPELISLSDFEDMYTLEEIDLLNMAHDISEVLLQLGKRKKVHRDIKRDNVFVDFVEGEARYLLGDFGIITDIKQGSRSGMMATEGLEIPEVHFNLDDNNKFQHINFPKECNGPTLKSDQYLFGHLLLSEKNDLVTTWPRIEMFNNERNEELNGFESEELTRIAKKAFSIRQEDRYDTNEMLHNDVRKLKGNLDVQTVNIVTYKNDYCNQNCKSTSVVLELKEKKWLLENGKVKKFARNLTGKFEAVIRVTLKNGLTFEKKVQFEKKNNTEGLWQIAYLKDKQYLKFYLSDEDAKKDEYAARVNLMDLRLNARKV